MANISTYIKYLETYGLEEILELNEVTEEELLKFCVEEEFLILPLPAPVDI